MHVHTRSLDPYTEHDVEASFRIQDAARRQDVPDFPLFSRTENVGQLRHPWPGMIERHWLAESDGEPTGLLTVGLPQLDNTHLADVHLTVHPEGRRRGAGRALHAAAVEFARAHDRRVLGGEYVTQLPGGPERDAAHAAFADAIGAKAALPEVRRRLDLDMIDRLAWADLSADARAQAAGYSVVAWTDETPEEFVADVARLDSRLVLDAPMGDLDVEPEKIDAARIRANEQMMRTRGRRPYHAGVRHDATGRLVAWTMINFDADVATHAWQQITIVDPEHRGHRLGLLVKIENLRHTLDHEPLVRHINTWNAAENIRMIAINEALGFRPVDGWVSWQQEI